MIRSRAAEGHASYYNRKSLKMRVLSFKEFMSQALYDPEIGYYAGPKNPVGEDGDFITSPRISEVFGFALAGLVSEFLARQGDAVCSIVDIGCGDGSLLRQLASSLSFREHRQAHFFGVDRNLGRIEGGEKPGEQIDFLTSVEVVPQQNPALVIANELFDALPFARLVQRQDGLHELWVREEDGRREWVELPAPHYFQTYFAEREIKLVAGQFADVALEWGELYESICRIADRAMIVTIDYGFPDRQLFDPRIRKFGTAAAFRHHAVHRDLLAEPGNQDLTAHINFSDLRRSGERSGFQTLLFSRQAEFLLRLGITEHPLFTPVQDLPFDNLLDASVELEKRQAARRLVLPDGIGQEMRVLVQSRNLPESEWSFQRKLF